MKVLVAPNTFRGSLDAYRVADAICRGWLAGDPSARLVKMPVADGGDLTGRILCEAFGAEIRSVATVNSMGDPIESNWGYVAASKTAILELADSSGNRLIERGKLNPMLHTTYGTGLVAKAALDMGCTRIIMGVGGSATVDGGQGFLQALGVQFFDGDANEVSHTENHVHRIKSMSTAQLDRRAAGCTLIIPSDITACLLGPAGAAYRYGPQKGATPEQVPVLEAGLESYAKVIQAATKRDILSVVHGAAAGGITAGLYGVLNAQLVAGSKFILDQIGFDEALPDSSLVITGEGKLDDQTLDGKAPYEVARRAQERGIPVLAFGGEVPDHPLPPFTTVQSITNKPMPLQAAIDNVETLLEAAARNAATLSRVRPNL